MREFKVHHRIDGILHVLIGLMGGILLFAIGIFVGLDFRTDGVLLGLTFSLVYIGWVLISRLLLPASKVGVVVGVDGVLVRGRFIPHFKIGAVCHKRKSTETSPGMDGGNTTSDGWVVLLQLEGGEEVDLVGTHWVDANTVDAEGEELAQTIEAARANRVDGQRGPDIVEAVIGRGSRTGSGWLQALRSMASGSTTDSTPYRAVEVDYGELSRLLDDTRTKPSIRATAAIVLAASGDQTTTTRLRIASEAMASPQLRQALKRVADGSDDAAIAEALEILDEADRKERARLNADHLGAPQRPEPPNSPRRHGGH